MRKVVTIWAHDEAYFLKEVCLLEAARAHAARGIGDIDVLCLYGFRFVKKYRRELARYGYRLHDGAAVYDRIVRRYARLKAGRNIFIFNNLIRWIAIRDYFGTDTPICGFDADLVVTSDIFASGALTGLTMTSSSTCFVVIHDMGWFAGYEKLLTLFNDEPAQFQALWDRTLDDYIRRMVTPADPVNEESFVRFAIRLGEIPEHVPADFPYYVVPFFLDFRDTALPFDQPVTLPVQYTRTAEGDCWNGKPLAYVHFQAMFVDYVARHLLLSRVLGVKTQGRTEPLWRLQAGLADRPDVGELLDQLKARCIRGEFGKAHRELFTRRAVMNAMLVEGDLSPIFSDAYWYAPGAFR